MAINFPNSPTVNQVFTVNGVNYIWDGTKWAVAAGTNPALGTAAFRNVPATSNATLAEAVLGSDTRLADARAPTPHTHVIADITDYAPTAVRMWHGAISNSSTNNQIAWSNTLPTVANGAQVFTKTITPIRTDTVFVITFTLYTTHTNRDAVVTAALFRGTTCVSANPNTQGVRTNNQVAGTFSATYVDATVRSNLDPVTFSLRVGANVRGTTHINQGTSGQNYNGAGAGAYTIMEMIRTV